MKYFFNKNIFKKSRKWHKLLTDIFFQQMINMLKKIIVHKKRLYYTDL